MQFHYDLTGAEPIVRDVPVYDASTTASFVKGELLMLGATDPDSDADQGISFITAYVSASANEGVDALGTILETVANAAALYNGAAPAYAKAIINPFAVYLCEYSQAAADDTAITTGGVSTSLTITSIEDDIEGGWAYFPLAAGAAKGKLRFITEATTNTLTVDSAITTTTADTIIKILPVNHRLTSLNAGATALLTKAAAGSTVTFHIAENYIQSDGHGLQPLRPTTHAGLNSLTNARFYADLVMLDHVYNNA
jgi:hypothetical protein